MYSRPIFQYCRTPRNTTQLRPPLINLYSKLAVSRLGYSCGVFSLSWFEKHSNAISVSHQLSTHILPAADRHRPTPRHWLAARRPTSRRSEAICSSGKLLIGTARNPLRAARQKELQWRLDLCGLEEGGRGRLGGGRKTNPWAQGEGCQIRKRRNVFVWAKRHTR